MIFREDSSGGGIVTGGGSGGAFTRWLREFRRETYKVNSSGGNSGNSGNNGTYHTTAEDGRRRHSFNAHDKNATRQQVDSGPGGSHVTHAPRAPCRRANSTVAPKSRY